ncbi:NADH-ubiquinone oxidoreductase chain G [Candidatus Palibaumannia cicadellinicola]|uniref:NADH-quinone oxidoreductase n=2 Tax=Candidatus Palibaumannia cicadellinicola TaxID=186490 RepID=A0A0K2BLI1_9GAMM|nr:NADH-ubiquinone oxidoreductase chain G [Candidatus Baumannia cicadellinicola]
MVTIYIDGKQYDVKESNNLLEACLSLGIDIPYFCWHPVLGSVGACRQCAIKQYHNVDDTSSGKLVMSCMTPVVAGMIISVNDHEIRQFRKIVGELLMINHPHDCPVCEEGGHCHLQDMTVMTGQYIRRYRFTKRTHYNQYLGPFISHDMNRCITCYRCIRYYKDYADGLDFGVYGTHDNIYFGRLQAGVLESEFSGNLVEMCPTGVFTDKTHSERYNRKWDMQFAPSICQQCSIGCNISPGERYGELRRIENRYNGSVNHYFLCDIGRFGYGYVNLKNRPSKPLQRRGNDWISLNVEQALQGAADILRQANKIIGIGSPRASLESNFALRQLVGKDNFYIGIAEKEQYRLSLILKVLKNSGIKTPSLREIESYDTVLVLGEDITQTGARIALAVRQAVKGKMRSIAASHNILDWQIAAIMNVGQNEKNLLFVTNVDKTKLDDVAAWSYHAPVDDQARLGFAIANALDNRAPEVKNIDQALHLKIELVVNALVNAHKPLIISGSNAGSDNIIAAAANIALALKLRGSDVGISFVVSSVNSMGLAMIGGGSLDNALSELEQGAADSLIVLENDLYRHALASRIDHALENITNLIVIDHQRTTVQNKANLILSATCFVESNGTVINQEGRAQRFFQVYNTSYYDQQLIRLESWRWLHLLQVTYLSSEVKWTNIDHVIDSLVQELPHLSEIKQASPSSNFRIHGQKLTRSPNRYSGRTANIAHLRVHEPRVSQDNETMFTFSMEGNNDPISPRQQIAFPWAPGWNSPQSWNKFQEEIGGNLRYGNPGVRLLEANNKILNLDWFKIIPPSFVMPKDGTWRVAPYWHLVGSDETSQMSPLINKHMPAPYVVISSIAAIRLGISSGSMLAFSYDSQDWCLPVRFSDRLSDGHIGLPLGFPGIPPIMAGLNVENLREVKK